jgi:hypothetical protein
MPPRRTRSIFALPEAQPPGPHCSSEELRKAVQGEIRVWRITRASLAARAGVMVRALSAWLDQDATFEPTEKWLAAVRAAWLQLVREHARAYLERWDPEGYGRAVVLLAEDRKRRQAELEARMVAAGEVA